MPFFVVLISWLTIIFVTFSLFADSNATIITALGIFAFSAAAANLSDTRAWSAVRGPDDDFRRAAAQRA